MSSRRTRTRPRRGPDGPDVIVSGDTGTYAGPQGGARAGRDAYRESGDLQSREYGVPQADIPGGKTHVVNPETHPDRPPGVPERPADYHKYHGVESDDGPYTVPSSHVGNLPATPVPKDAYTHAIPVTVVENPDRPKAIRRAMCEQITCVSQATPNEPTRICGVDTYRDEVMLRCVDASNDIFFAESQATLLEGRGAKLVHTDGSYTRVATQDFLYAWSSSSTATSLLSVVIVTETQL